MVTYLSARGPEAEVERDSVRTGPYVIGELFFIGVLTERVKLRVFALIFIILSDTPRDKSR